MGFNPETGQYTPDDPTDVGQQVTGLLSKDSPYLKQATTAGMKSAGRRGLLNSSMGVGAVENARIGAALPIASQNAQQAQQLKLQQGQFGHETSQQATQIASQEKIATMNTAAFEREKSAAHVAAVENAYAEAFRTIGQNENLPADVRDKYLKHVGAIRDSSMALVEQMWGIDLDWGEATPTP